MSKNTSNQSLEEKLVVEVRELRKKLAQLRTNQLNVLIIPVLTSDPASLTDGEIWYNSTSNTFKCRQNGVTKTFTVS